MDRPLIIASYPRSGSTWLRFILSNLHYPDINHTFDTVNKHIPTIESQEEIIKAINQPLFLKTHNKRTGNIIHLMRHVGDVLLSEYYFQKKFYHYDKTLSEFIIENDFGKNWREFINWYAAYGTIRYEDMLNEGKLIQEITGISSISDINRITAAISKCTFNQMQQVESEHPFENTNQEIRFIRSGKKKQWESHELAEKIIKKNNYELKLMGYL